jgi:hypothetical protein
VAHRRDSEGNEIQAVRDKRCRVRSRIFDSYGTDDGKCVIRY